MSENQAVEIKRVESEYDENTIYGVYHVRRVKVWKRNIISDYPKKGETFSQIIETTIENGVIVHSAAYPEDSEYARMRLS